MTVTDTYGTSTYTAQQLADVLATRLPATFAERRATTSASTSSPPSPTRPASRSSRMLFLETTAKTTFSRTTTPTCPFSSSSPHRPKLSS
ncbi:hypothetical protein ACFQZC_00825 [Streptacidiphilus monticola]